MTETKIIQIAKPDPHLLLDDRPTIRASIRSDRPCERPRLMVSRSSALKWV